MRPANDRLFSWILGLGPKARYNLTSSGLGEPDLRAMGIDTSFERFAAERDHEQIFAKEVASLYHVEPQNIVPTNGGSEAIFLVYSVLGAGRTALVPLPNYGPMFNVPKALGMEVGATLSTTAKAKETIFGLTDPNNPTGLSLDEEAVETITRPSQHGSPVFINETYREFTFPEAPRTHFARAENIVVCSTMTKFYGLGRLRVGWVIADKATAQKILYAKWAVSGHDSEYSLWIAAQVLKKRKRFVERARLIRSRNISLVRKFIEETGLPVELGAAPFCLVRYGRGPSSVEFATALFEKTGVLVSPGDFFGAPRAFRLCFTAEEEALRAGLGELSGYLRRTSK